MHVSRYNERILHYKLHYWLCLGLDLLMNVKDKCISKLVAITFKQSDLYYDRCFLNVLIIYFLRSRYLVIKILNAIHKMVILGNMWFLIAIRDSVKIWEISVQIHVVGIGSAD
jgi:hypothetical protein